MLASACAQAKDTKVYKVDGFESYVRDFSAAGNVHIDNLVIKLEAPSHNKPAPGKILIGECVASSTPTVNIDPVYWKNANPGDKAELVWHELGHCVLGRTHNDAKLPSGKPASIMNSDHFDAQIIVDDVVYYRDELFGQ